MLGEKFLKNEVKTLVINTEKPATNQKFGAFGSYKSKEGLEYYTLEVKSRHKGFSANSQFVNNFFRLGGLIHLRSYVSSDASEAKSLIEEIDNITKELTKELKADFAIITPQGESGDVLSDEMYNGKDMNFLLKEFIKRGYKNYGVIKNEDIHYNNPLLAYSDFFFKISRLNDKWIKELYSKN
jgi:hypothetical protein